MDDQALKQLAAQKEKEWLAVMQERYRSSSSVDQGRGTSDLSFRLAALEKTIEQKDQQLGEVNQKYLRLSEDFKYNLKLIDERDKELATFDQRFKGFFSCFSQTFDDPFVSFRDEESSQREE